MNKLWSNGWFYLCILIAFAIGIGVGLPFNLEGLSISSEISIVEVAGLFITIGLAIYVAKSLEKRVQDERIEREIHIEQIKTLSDMIGSLRGLLTKSPINYNEVVSHISNCRIKKKQTLETIEELPGCKTSELYNSLTTQITQSMKELKRLLTETSAAGKRDVVVSNNKATYSEKRRSQISKAILGLENSLYRLTILVNKI